MPFLPAFLEFLGTTEMLVIAVVALIIFGPRRLPEIGRTVGKGLAEFKRASEDFKRTWEREVEIDRIERDLRAEVGDAAAALEEPVWPQVAGTNPADASWDARAIARTGAAQTDPAADPAPPEAETAPDPPRHDAHGAAPQKHDWL